MQLFVVISLINFHREKGRGGSSSKMYVDHFLFKEEQHFDVVRLCLLCFRVDYKQLGVASVLSYLRFFNPFLPYFDLMKPHPVQVLLTTNCKQYTHNYIYVVSNVDYVNIVM